MKISIELIPREETQLIKEAEFISQKYHMISTVNIPDLLKFDIRSWEACKIIRSYYNCSIPHIRAIDFNIKDLGKLKQIIEEHELKEILVLAGDIPQNIKKIYPTTSLELIRRLKELKGLKVYAAIDQYRTSIKKELEYVQQKLDAGADGFFTQPFFDIRLMEMYMEYLNDTEVYLGISPILSERSANYWEIKNNVVFPKDFQYNMEWNTEFARKVLSFAAKTNTNVYFMPIKTDLENYLSMVFEAHRDDK